MGHVRAGESGVEERKRAQILVPALLTTLPPQIVEPLNDNTTTLYPNTARNSYNHSDNPSSPRKTIVSVDGPRIGPYGLYWGIDGGPTGAKGSTKLVDVNLTTNAVDELYLENVKANDSGADDAHFSASGEVGNRNDTADVLTFLNLTLGHAVRALASSDSVTAWFPMMYNSTLVPGYSGNSSFAVGLNNIEISLDGA
ncbi:hypothetical protein N7490_009954 [Penicillium lividum]|nr:hypothetical protein N7490_009954 [Penicillium lividum]